MKWIDSETLAVMLMLGAGVLILWKMLGWALARWDRKQREQHGESKRHFDDETM